MGLRRNIVYQKGFRYSQFVVSLVCGWYYMFVVIIGMLVVIGVSRVGSDGRVRMEVICVFYVGFVKGSVGKFVGDLFCLFVCFIVR